MAEYIDRNRLIKKFCNRCYFDVGEKNCAEDCYDMKIIKSLPTEDVQPVKWIPVTDRLPELNQEVLVYAVGKIDGFIGSSAFALTERFLFKFFPSSVGREEWRSPWEYFMTDYEITHWMPLPEPPKEES